MATTHCKKQQNTLSAKSSGRSRTLPTSYPLSSEGHCRLLMSRAASEDVGVVLSTKFVLICYSSGTKLTQNKSNTENGELQRFHTIMLQTENP